MLVSLIGTAYRYDVQSLCQTFFPCENFSADTGRVLTVTATPDSVKAVFEENGKKYEAEQQICEKFDKERFAVKKAVYLCLEKATGRSSPWGIMTGIKPAVFYEKLIKNSGRAAADIFQNDYMVLPQKIRLCESVLRNRAPALEALGENDAGFYVSVPFCPSRCRYCSFVSASTQNEGRHIAPYIQKLCAEIRGKAEFIKEHKIKITTLYIGGGTPTVLSSDQLELILGQLRNSLDLSGLIEYTVEAGRPDTITDEKLKTLKKYGVTRISVNPQTLEPPVLKAIGRGHTVDDFYRAYELAYGLFDINVDLIAGLPLDTVESFERSLCRVKDMAPQNITVHSLYLKKASDFTKEHSVDPVAQSGLTFEMITLAEKLCESSGYLPYYLYRQKNTLGNCENVGFSQPGKQCFYNIYMMDDLQPIIAAGANATTKLDIGKKDFKRICNTKFAYNYINEVHHAT